MPHPEKREPKGVRKHRRREKANIRKEFAPTIDHVSRMIQKAEKRLGSIDARLSSFINSNNKQETIDHSDIFSHTKTSYKSLGDHVSSRIRDQLGSHAVSYFGELALGFVERVWIAKALEVIDHDEVIDILGEFLNTCPQPVQTYLESYTTESRFTRLQEVKNKVINPVTKVLDIK